NDLRRNGPLPSSTFDCRVTLNVKYIWRVTLFVLPVGVIALFFLARLPGFADIGNLSTQRDFELSGWVLITQTWAGTILVALIYWYGFRWWLVIPICFYLFILTYQGYHRFRVLIPILLMLQIYLDRRNRHWPSLTLVLLALTAALLFAPLKTIGRMLQEGAPINEIWDESIVIINNVLEGEDGSSQLLDQFAAYVALTNEAGTLNHGRSYIALIALPLPRAWWPEKPSVN